MSLVLATILAHLVSDFLPQTDLVIESKAKMNGIGFLTHGLAVFLLTIVPAHLYGIATGFLYALLISLAHTTIDLIKAATSRFQPAGQNSAFLL